MPPEYCFVVHDLSKFYLYRAVHYQMYRFFFALPGIMPCHREEIISCTLTYMGSGLVI
jgi:hypothetical protein